ncbi:probable cytochrome P450 12a5, mitochondrial [Artemia franciscana]
MILCCHQLIARFEKHFQQPNNFIPERWIKDSSLAVKSHPYTLLPFGFGPRMCIGRRLAEQEMWLLTTKVLQSFRIEWHHEDMDCITRTVNVPDQPLQFRFIDRF